MLRRNTNSESDKMVDYSITKLEVNNSFINKDETNYRQEARLELSVVAKSLSKIGIQAVSLNQFWRHVTGEVIWNTQKYFFKMATTEGISAKTQNEVRWNNFINSQNFDLGISVPKIKHTGFLNGLFFYLAEFVDGEALILPSQKDDAQKLNIIEDMLEQITNFTAQLQNLGLNKIETANQILLSTEDFKTSNDDKNLEMSQNYLAKIKSWVLSEDQMQISLEPLLNMVEENIEFWTYCVNHGDFTPWHIMRTTEHKLYLIDGEHADLKPDFYDISYFYHRTFTKLENPELANKFLHLSYSKLLPAKQNLFQEIFPSVLASRIIGGFFDAYNDKVTDLKFHVEIKKLS